MYHGVLFKPTSPPRAVWFGFLLLSAAVPISQTGPTAILWTAPAILISAVLIAWAAESAQFFIAQGFALAILAWLQTAPEFAVEAVVAWHRQVDLMLAGLTGALRLLTGLGWPVIYLTAALFQRKRGGKPLRAIRLHFHHAVEVMGLLGPLLYMGVVAYKGTLNVMDGVVLILLYSGYLVILSKMPPEDAEQIDELETVPRYIVTSRKWKRIGMITGLFVVGGLLIYFATEPFVGSLLALATAVGVPQFLFMQWINPVVSEFPELLSTFYWARTVDKAPVALMNMVSSNINQWTLLVAMLPVILSWSAGSLTPIVFDERQHVELVLTLAQAGIGWLFLLNMRLEWWEAALLFVFFVAALVHHDWAWYVSYIYFAWIGVEIVRILVGGRSPLAFREFRLIWRTYVLGKH